MQIELRERLLASSPSLITSGQELLARWTELMPQRGGQEFAPFILKGRFEHEHEVYIGVRGKPGAIEEGIGAGYSIVTPFIVEGDGKEAVKVLVNRGWVPNAAKPQRAEARATVVRTNSAGVAPVQELRVVVRKGEKGAAYCRIAI